ncbi:hypothetical protein FCM35_KLT22124 [Carex littledalei]|uniref:Uncharacterized protein n=1 Tax=Carex littledalei TaxID=544730 RepID=A0A833QKX7_9POAL|nr:hypothetical protein FCM35_KLT22124 [Carex littledalei]
MGSSQADAPATQCRGARGERAGSAARRRHNPGRARPWAAGKPASVRARDDRHGGPPERNQPSPTGAHRQPIRFPGNFKHSLTLFSKSFHLSLAVLVRYRSLASISLGRSLRPIWAAFPNNPIADSARGAAGSGPDGAHLPGAPFQGTWARSVARSLLQTTIRAAVPPRF